MREHIDKWRNDLYATGNFNGEELNELESHLMDEMEHVEASSLTEKEKMLVAQDRIGSFKTLSKAYGDRKFLNFNRFSLLAQMVLFIMVFINLNRLGNSIMVYISTNYYFTDSHMLSFYFGQQVVSLSLVVWLLYRVFKMSMKEKKLIKANLLSMAMAGGSLILLISLSYLFQLNPLLPQPLLVYVVPNSFYIIGFFLFAIATFRAWKKGRTRLATT